MFGKKKEEPVVAQAPVVEETPKNTFIKADKTVIGPGITMIGDFSGTDPVIIEGTLKGTVQSENNLHIASRGQLIGDGKVDTVDVDGFIDGNVDCKKLASFTNTGKMRGNLSTARLKTDDGSKFEGTLTLTEKIITSTQEPVIDPVEEPEKAE